MSFDLVANKDRIKDQLLPLLVGSRNIQIGFIRVGPELDGSLFLYPAEELNGDVDDLASFFSLPISERVHHLPNYAKEQGLKGPNFLSGRNSVVTSGFIVGYDETYVDKVAVIHPDLLELMIIDDPDIIHTRPIDPGETPLPPHLERSKDLIGSIPNWSTLPDKYAVWNYFLTDGLLEGT
jgi:hypothetical protein